MNYFKDGLQTCLWRQNQVSDCVLTFLQRVCDATGACCREDVLLFVLEVRDKMKMNRDEEMMIRSDPSGNNNQQFAVPGC